MFRLAPATASTARLLAAAAALVLVVLTTKACDRPLTDVTSESEAVGTQAGSSPNAPCTAPCVIVEVVQKGSAGRHPDDPHVVTLVQGGPDGIGPFPCQSGNTCTEGDRTNPLVRVIDTSNGLAVFGPETGYDLRAGAGYCAFVRPLVSTEDVFGAIDDAGRPTFIYPAPVPPEAVPARAGGAVTKSEKKDLPLTKQSIIEQCIKMSNGAPFVVGSHDVVKVTLRLKPFSTDRVACVYYDGSGTAPVQGGRICPAWTMIALDTDLDGETPLSINWLTDDQQRALSAGVRLGLLVSAASENVSQLHGLTPNETYYVEVASQVPYTRQQTTASLKGVTSPGGGQTSPTIPAPVDPLVCQVNTELDAYGDVTAGIDFGDVSHGHFAVTPLSSALFVADRARTSIFYNYRDAGATTGSAQLVTARFRLKPNPYFLNEQPDGYPETLSFQVTYDFSACPATEDPLVPVSQSGPGSAAVNIVVECRPDGDQVRVTWSIEMPSTRVMSFGFQALQDVVPNPSRDNDESARVSTPFPVGADGIYGVGETFPDDCPLPNSTIGGGTNDPKWLNPIG
jgi:hypothetical protein